MKKQHSRILTALMVISALSLPLAAESLTGGGAVGSSGDVGASGVGNVGTSVDGNVAGSASGADAAGAAGTSVNVDANSGAKPGAAVDEASASVERTDAAVRSDFQAFSDRLDALDKRIDENVSNNVYTLKEAAERRADLAGLRARLRTKAGHIRHLTVAQRDRVEAAIRNQEKAIKADVSAEDSSDSGTDVNAKQ